jgi:hypothetical protein
MGEAELIATLSSIIGSIAVFWKVAAGQGVAKSREEQHTQDIQEIKNSLKLIENGESKCKLKFTEDIATLKQKTYSVQAEITEMKQK